MTKLYDDVKNKIKKDDNNDQDNQNEDNQPVLKSVQPVMKKPNKPKTYMNNSLMDSELNDSDMDLQKLENFNLNLKSDRSMGEESANRVSYYNKNTRPKPSPLKVKGKLMKHE
jgi:hypothetical protein